jgi:phospholipase D1/2
LTSGGNGVVKPASSLATMVDKPSAPETIKAIQELAAGNQAIYEKTFVFVPSSNQPGSTEASASIWPVVQIILKSDKTRELVEPIHVYADRMPFSDKFWELGKKIPQPSGIHGFFTALPIDWTNGENNHPEMNKLLLTQVVEPDGRQTVALSDATRQNGGQS